MRGLFWRSIAVASISAAALLPDASEVRASNFECYTSYCYYGILECSPEMIHELCGGIGCSANGACGEHPACDPYPWLYCLG